MRKLRPLNTIAELPQKMQERVYHVLVEKTYDDAQEFLQKPESEGGVGKRISKKTLRTYHGRCTSALLLADRPGAAKRASRWLAYAATGDATRFDDAAVEVIKQRSFELAESMKDESEFAQFKTLMGIVFQARNTAVRERIATVREENVKIRARESGVRRTKMDVETTALLGRIRKEEKETRENGEERTEWRPPADPKDEKDPVARVIQHCGSVAKFFQKMGPKERIMEAVARLNKDIDEGRLQWQPWDESDEPLTEGDRQGWGWKLESGLMDEEELRALTGGKDGNVVPFETTESEAATSEANPADEAGSSEPDGPMDGVTEGGV